MADYQMTASDTVLRTVDQAWIPNDPLNRDRIEYEKWLGVAGNVPDPYVAPPPYVVVDKRQFWMQAAIGGQISENDAGDAMGGDLPHDIHTYIHTLAPALRFPATMAFLSDTFARNGVAAARFREAFSLTDALMDSFFNAAKAL